MSNNDGRAHRTGELIRTRGSDVDRWADIDALSSRYHLRARRAADLIPDGVRILDVGCGAMTLKRFLKPGCDYTPADMIARDATCLVADLNRQQFPPGSYDMVVMLGVLEYLHDVAWVIGCSRMAAPRLLTTYCVNSGGDATRPWRRERGWVNDFTKADIRELLRDAGGFTIDTEILDLYDTRASQFMFLCSIRS